MGPLCVCVCACGCVWGEGGEGEVLGEDAKLFIVVTKLLF